MRTRSWHPGAAVLLLVLLGAFATLQYRWLGEVSNAERDRLRAGLRARVADFTADVDRDVTRAFSAFQVDPAELDADPARTLANAADRAAAESAAGASLRGIFVVQHETPLRVSRFDLSSRTVETSSWPPELSRLAERLAEQPIVGVPGLPLPPWFSGGVIDATASALVVPVALPEPAQHIRAGQTVVTSGARSQAIVIWFDLDGLRRRLLEPLVARYFGEPAASEYNVTVAPRDGGPSIYSSGPKDVAPASADLIADLFALKIDELRWTRRIDAPPSGTVTARAITDRVAIAIVRRGSGEADAAAGATHLLERLSAWQVQVQAREGSLDALVARSRFRNLSISLGVLALLGASLALMLVVSAREQKLARQQIEFVASVSHELRTPLAVIRSAGENLADGVVAPEQVARYGALVRNEGRRLSDMVDRVLDYAGIVAGAGTGGRTKVSVSAILGSVVDDFEHDAQERGVTVAVRCGRELPHVLADAHAVRSALHNAVGNAIKYSNPNGHVDVDATAAGDRVWIVVSDRGIGIDKDDLAHVFEPFFRGRRAVASQERGSGVGLGIVEKIVRAHGGSVSIAAREGGGTVLTIDLPVAPRAELP